MRREDQKLSWEVFEIFRKPVATPDVEGQPDYSRGVLHELREGGVALCSAFGVQGSSKSEDRDVLHPGYDLGDGFRRELRVKPKRSRPRKELWRSRHTKHGLETQAEPSDL